MEKRNIIGEGEWVTYPERFEKICCAHRGLHGIELFGSVGLVGWGVYGEVRVDRRRLVSRDGQR